MTPEAGRYAACADIGGTKVLLGLVDRQGRVVARDRYPIRAPRAPEDVVDEMAPRLLDLASAAGIGWERVIGAALSVAFMGDVDRGVVLSAPNLGEWHDVPLAALAERALHRPVRLEMDANAAALGEAWKGLGAGTGHLVYIVVGTGIGAGIVMNGRVYHGWRGTAGELGHTTIVPGGPLCNCGKRGCLEALAAGPAIARRAEEALGQGRQTILGEPGAGSPITAETVFAAARKGDAVACEIVEQTAEYLGIGIANVLSLLNPEVIALGGGVIGGAADLLLGPLLEVVRRYSGSWIDLEHTRIAPGLLGEDAALIGAAWLAWEVAA